jgi:hypothetical protein
MGGDFLLHQHTTRTEGGKEMLTAATVTPGMSIHRPPDRAAAGFAKETMRAWC